MSDAGRQTPAANLTAEPQDLPRTPDLGGWLDRIAPRLAQPLSPAMRAQLLTYARLLREWSEKLNLTAILDDEGIAVRHYQDSLTLLPYLREIQAAGSRPLRLADVGTGAGFPGLVLKIACPELDVVLLDALRKRLNFLDAVIAELGLTGIRTVHARAEDAGRQKDLREQFDVAVARAVADLPVLAEYCLPLVRPGGRFLAMKGKAEAEMATATGAIHKLGGRIIRTDHFCLAGTDMQRTILIIEKVRPTPPAYPRRAGKVEQNPL
jgi:16S rRNA (guanine527-N7)-methyltransferase